MPVIANHSMKPPNRMYGLDILRFFLASAVMIYHFGYFGPIATGATSEETSLGPMVFAGRYGVLVFFLVSGFVITMSLAGRDWKEFLWARTRRLMPTLMLCATATFLVVTLFDNTAVAEVGPLWLKSVSFLPIMFGGDSLDDSYWSIAYEMRFYALVALLMFVGMTRHLDAVLLALSLFGIVLGIGFGRVEMACAVLFPYTSLFALGVLLATRVRDGASARWAILFLIHATLALAMLYLFGQLGRGVMGLIQSALVLSSSIGLLVLAAKIQLPANWHCVAGALGMISYPLYLLHQRIGYVLINALADSGLAVGWIIPAAMMTMVALAYIVAEYFERPLSMFLGRGGLRLAPGLRKSPQGETSFQSTVRH